MELMPHQEKVVDKLSSGKILWGGTGDGKSVAALAYYMKYERPRDIYVITTAKKRDSLDWEKEGARFGLSTDMFIEDDRYKNHYGILTIDSWNQLKNYEGIHDAFFIFDEQRLVGYGAWVKSFLKIAKSNHWLLLSGTPGDTWLDYAPVFIANGHYRNITDFKFQHVLYEPYHKYPKIKGYIAESRLEKLRNEILVEMPFQKHTERMINYIDVAHDQEMCELVSKKRWNPFEQKPVKDAGEVFRLTKRIVYSDPDRLNWVRKLMTCHPKLIIYYQYDFELEILRTLSDEIEVYEWNGHKKQSHKKFERRKKWVYLVQYVAGAEAWNCVSTDAMIFYSLTYSYKNFEQCQGRIDRMNTRFNILYYYVFVSNIWLDRAVKKSLAEKKSFNEREYVVQGGEKGWLL
jgi:hypothetical protein